MIEWITSKLAGPVLGAALIILAVVAIWGRVHDLATEASLRLQLRTATAEMNQSRADLGQCQANRAELQTQIALQNNAIDQLKASGAVATANANAAMAKARADGAAAAKGAAAILAIKPTGDLCKAAEAILTPGGVQ